jgi:hypothetical protein
MGQDIKSYYYTKKWAFLQAFGLKNGQTILSSREDLERKKQARLSRELN